MGVKKTLIGSDSAGRCSGILLPGSALDFLLSSYFSNQLSLSLSLLLSLSLSLSLALGGRPAAAFVQLQAQQAIDFGVLDRGLPPPSVQTRLEVPFLRCGPLRARSLSSC